MRMKFWADPSRYFNADSAKKLSALVLVGFIVYHGFLHVSYGIDSCKWLLSDGRFQGNHVWQPYGCMLHTYSKSDSRMCMRYIAYWGGRNKIVFMGDSRIRQLYHSFAKLIATHEEHIGPIYAHHDLKYEDSDLNLAIEFLWRPTINASMFEAYRSWTNGDQELPKIIVTGCATWSIKTSNASDLALEQYKSNLTRLLSSIETLGNTGTQILWVLQDPVDEDKLSPDRAMITNEQIDLYNKAALDVLKYARSDHVRVWSSSRLVSQGYSRDQSDGLHMGEVALAYAIQILLNMYCNDQMNYNDGNCCADQESITVIQIVTFAVVTIILAIAIAMIIHRRFFRRRRHQWTLLVNQDEHHDPDQLLTTTDIELDQLDTDQDPDTISLLSNNDTNYNRLNGDCDLPIAEERVAYQIPAPDAVRPGIGKDAQQPQSFRELISLLARVGLILAYFFLCDRTNFFMKENKYYTRPNFFLPIAYVFALGLFFTEGSKHHHLLHRDQTDEWKGWMQLVILTYHMTGASQVLVIYNHMRLLVSGYLFLSGFGHFTYFWNKGDHGIHRLWQLGIKQFPFYWRNRDNGIRRFLQVMFRLNFLVVCLCLAMNRPYQFYYFVPLVSFWFVIMYITLSSYPQITAQSSETNPIQYLYMVLKFVALYSIVTVLYMSEVFFEKIFLTRPWKALFVTTDDSIKEWWFRWKIDRYSVPTGMLFGFAYHLMKQHKLIQEAPNSNLFTSRSTTCLATLGSIIGICVYEFFAFTCRNKAECNEIHPYIFFIPIVSFIILRNVSGLLRNRYSLFFAWFGRISLELFIGQYHIWLAANTHGVLVLVPSYPVLNVVITLVIFVCISHEMHQLTRALVAYAIPADWRYLTRNFIIFAIILIPIGIKDGMF